MRTRENRVVMLTTPPFAKPAAVAEASAKVDELVKAFDDNRGRGRRAAEQPHVWQEAEFPVAGELDEDYWVQLWRGIVSTAGSPEPAAPPASW